MSARRLLLAPLALAVVLASCGGDSGGGAATGSPAPTSASTHHSTRATTSSTSAAETAKASIPVVEGAAARRMAVPILMYHVLGTPPAGTGLPELWVSKARLTEQIGALSKAGYQGVTLKAVWNAWTKGTPLPKKPVVFSFDDGYFSQAQIAAPALRKVGWPGVLNLAVRDLGPDGLPRHLAQQMVDRDGWEVDSHTLTHPDLRTVSAAQLKQELVGSRTKIRELLGVTPQFFCYPAGKYDATVEAAVKAAGYDAATTVDPGIAKRADDPFALPRVRITNADTGTALVQRLESGAAGSAVSGAAAGG